MARAKARAKATQMAKDAAGDGGAPRPVKGAIAPAARGPGFATRHNRPSGEAASLALVAPAAGSGATAAGCHGLRGLAAAAGRVPTAGRARVAMRTCDAGVALRSSAARQLRTLRRRDEIPAEIVVALGMHGIPRYGRTALGWLVCGRREGGTPGRERHMTAQCAANRMWVTPGAVRVTPGDSVEVAFSTVYRRVRAVRQYRGMPCMPSAMTISPGSSPRRRSVRRWRSVPPASHARSATRARPAVGTLPATAASPRGPGHPPVVARGEPEAARGRRNRPLHRPWRAPVPGRVPGHLRRLRPCFRPRHRRPPRAP